MAYQVLFRNELYAREYKTKGGANRYLAKLKKKYGKGYGTVRFINR